MTQLSVNLNKIALLRNSREGSEPNVVSFAQRSIELGAMGITVHPRPDGRHIRHKDVFALSKAISVELNIEGNPTREFVELVHEVKPAQVTLVPDDPSQLTSDHGWDVVKDGDFLCPIISDFRLADIRVSLFMDPVPDDISRAAEVGADRVELYTEAYARTYGTGEQEGVLQGYIDSGVRAGEVSLGLNAGHDLSQKNLGEFCRRVPNVLEVSIGHALVSEALVQGWEATIRNYVSILNGAGE
jgi:pyridoxine 5-phosphate synthase